MSKTLQQIWREVCDNYLLAFCEKHGYIYEPDMWIANNPGTIIMIGDMYVDMENIRYDIDNNIPENKFEKWYWKSLELHELGVDYWMNYESFCKGAPDKWSPERMKKIHQLKQKIEKLTDEFNETVQRYSTSEQQGF